MYKLATSYQQREVIPIQLIVARGDRPEVFDAVEKAFNGITSFINLGIEVAWVPTVSVKRNYRMHSMLWIISIKARESWALSDTTFSTSRPTSNDSAWSTAWEFSVLSGHRIRFLSSSPRV